MPAGTASPYRNGLFQAAGNEAKKHPKKRFWPIAFCLIKV
jgi:hypothetical protein